MAFKDFGKHGGTPDTLYFNAYTEDLFSWDNDLEDDQERVLKFNSTSSFFSGLQELELENRIRPFLNRYTDFNFNIDYEKSEVSFSRQVRNGAGTEIIDHIKVSRGEENLFVWCFFLAIVQLAMDRAEAYKWVKYVYIDDPISSLDENNAIAVGHHLAQLLARKDHSIKAVLSSHHSLFYNVLWNELREIDRKKFAPYFLSCSQKTGQFHLIYTGDTRFFHHVALLKELCEARMRQSAAMRSMKPNSAPGLSKPHSGMTPQPRPAHNQNNQGSHLTKPLSRRPRTRPSAPAPICRTIKSAPSPRKIAIPDVR